MAAISSTTIHDRAYLYATHTIHVRAEGPISSLPFPRLNFRLSQKNLISPRLRICYKRKTTVEKCLRVPATFCLMGSNSEACPETDQTYVPNDAAKEAAIDLKLPRRSLLVTFTCNSCDARSQKLINRLAYERGLVYVQCSGCSKYHKLVDNLGLVVEYNLREETDQI
ncbi:DNL-type zinc finger protein [Olea europaea var. sylvestris]|uniref:Mitochondrial import ZIM17 n=1 Tax=Olea europaea subsp. europaea TaxID=158383 RepID=A0A8S0T7R4_OLEEU|nr:DNL-type zinc finger protein [Olea europaea var. sylvestris]CAA3001017.1 mitochondrial import ZIM17 [Olea europaea subsp. europaea]